MAAKNCGFRLGRTREESADSVADSESVTTLFFWSIPALIFSCLMVMQKRKTCCYVDFDQTTGEDDVMQNAASLTWPGPSSVQQTPNACVKSTARESVTYEDEDASSLSIIRGRFYNNQFSSNHVHPGNWMHTASRYGVFILVLYLLLCIVLY